MRVYIILLGMFNIFISCNTDDQIKNYIIISYRQVDEGYEYSRDILEYNKYRYMPILSSEYINNTLTSITIFKSEGKLKYDLEALKVDTIFRNMLNVPNTRKLEINNTFILDNNRKYQICETQNDNVFCLKKDSLFIYRINY